MTAPEMERTPWTIGALFRCGLAAGSVVVFFTWIDNYANLFWSGPLPIRLVIAFIGIAAAMLVIDSEAPIALVRSPVLVWTCAFFLVVTVWAAFTVSSPFDNPALRSYYRSIGLLVALAMVFDDPRSRRIGALALAAAVVFASLLNLAEFFGAIAFHGQEDLRVAGRAAGLYVNANGAGFAIVFGLAVVLDRLPRSWRLPLLLVGTAGVAVTFSRGAGISLAALVPALVWRKQIGGWRAAFACALVAVLIASEGDRVIRAFDGAGLLTADTSARLHLEQDDSGRVELAEDAWRTFLDAPLFGKGLGATVQSHNQFLTLAGDHGVVGLVLFPALALALVLANRAAVPFAIVLLIAGFFSHNLLDDRSSLVAIAFAAVGAAHRRYSPGRATASPAAERGEAAAR